MQLEHATTDINTEQKTKSNRFTRYSTLTLFLGLLIVFGIGAFIRNAPHKKRTSPEVKAARTSNIPTKPTAISPTTSATEQRAVPKTTLTSPTSMKKMPYHTSTHVSGFPGMNKVVINASLKIAEEGLLFTNNERQDWRFCYATINFDAGPSKWYEYDFTGILAGQTHTVVWSQLTRNDGTHFTNTADEQRMIQLICLLDDNTIGFARFP